MYYYQHHIGDYRRDTSHLTLLEHGAYRQLLDLYYITEKPLDANALRLVCARNADEVSAVEQMLCEFFKLQDGKYYHKRCEDEITRYHSKSNKAKESAKIRWNKNNELQDANALPTDSERNANHKPLTINQEPLTNSQEPIADNHKPKTNKGSRLSKDWVIPIEYVDFCNKERPELNAENIAEQFKDYWIGVAGAKGVKTDWFATWRNWVRNQKINYQSKTKFQQIQENNRKAGEEFLKDFDITFDEKDVYHE